MKTKERLLNKLEIKLVKLDNAIFQREGIRNGDEEYVKKRVEAIENVNNLKKEISLLFSQAITQTREETISEVENMINKEFPHQKLYCEAQDLRCEILEELNKLKK